MIPSNATNQTQICQVAFDMDVTTGDPDIADIPDITAVEVPRLEMIVDAPRVATVAIAEDGLPVWIAAADPRWWAADKLWLSEEPTREPIKRRRDADQGRAVVEMLARN